MLVAAAARLVGDGVPVRAGRLGPAPGAVAEVFGSAVVPVVLAIAGAVPGGWAPPVRWDPSRADRPAAARVLVGSASCLPGVIALAIAAALGGEMGADLAATALVALVANAVPLPGGDLGAVISGGPPLPALTRRLPPAVGTALAVALVMVVLGQPVGWLT